MALRQLTIAVFIIHAIAVLSANSDGDTSTKFLYFGYGSNLLARRVLLLDPTATRKAIGELRNYRLDFYNNTERWAGAGATIVHDTNDTVLGSLWEIDEGQREILNVQESTNGLYVGETLPVYTSADEYVDAVVYRQTIGPVVKNHGYRPSKTYINLIVKGAEEAGLPASYIDRLKAVEHNGRLADEKIRSDLQLDE